MTWDEASAKIDGWLADPEALRDVDFDPPGRDVLLFAEQYISRSERRGSEPPSRVIPTGDGSVVFEWLFDGDVSLSLEIEPDGRVSLMAFHDCTVVASVYGADE